MTGRVDFIFIGISSGLPFIQNKQLVPLAVSSAKRSPTLPDLPTTLEAGYKDSDFNYWNGMLVPAKTPGPVIERLLCGDDEGAGIARGSTEAERYKASNPRRLRRTRSMR